MAAASGASQTFLNGESGRSATDLIGGAASTLFSKGASAVITAGIGFRSYAAKTVFLSADAVQANKESVLEN